LTFRRRDEARVLFDYLRADADRIDGINAADVVIGFGVDDLRVPDHCVRLHREGRAPLVLFTGGLGSGSGDFTEPEALVFKKRALEQGMPEEAVLVEFSSTNTKENVLFSRELLRKKHPPVRRAIVVAQPHRQRRVYLTCRKHLFPVKIVNCPPPASFEGEIARFGEDIFNRCLTGEVERIVRYGATGDLFPEEIPRVVMEAYLSLGPIGR
jgi:hypothetical protein